MSTETEALAALIALPLVKQERDEMRVRVAEMEKDARRDFAAHVMIVEALKVRASAALSRAEAAERKLAEIEMALTVKWTKAEARARALEGALRDLLCVWWPSTEEGHTGFVDRLGMQFYDETRIWPPFKSAPLEMCVASTDEERMAASKAWRQWLEAKRFAAADEARALLSAAPGEESKGHG